MERTTKLKTVNIKGKEYTEVHQRLQFLADEFDYEISTTPTLYEDLKMWVVKATLTIHEGDRVRSYEGHAQEIIGEGYINKTSALENAETSAVGRACAMAGIGINDSVASIDEINKAEAREKYNEAQPTQKEDKPWLNENTDAWKGVVEYLSGDGSIDKIKEKYRISKANELKLQEITLKAMS